MAISGQSGDRVAFHGQAEAGFNDIDAVFTQTGVVAQVGDTLSTGTLDQIDPEGKVAINNFDQVAFHGSVEIEGGLFDEQFRVVFISDGVETREAVREASKLPDGTPLDDINENGGVAINLFGDVAFHGDAIVPDTGGDSVKAVFTQNGLVAKEGDILPGGTPLDEIEVNGGVAINLNGDVVFHGRTGGDKAVFTQNGLVARVDENLADGTTLNEIWDTAGVAINPYGSEVAFHGKVDSTDAVFVGQAPLPPSSSSTP